MTFPGSTSMRSTHAAALELAIVVLDAAVLARRPPGAPRLPLAPSPAPASARTTGPSALLPRRAALRELAGRCPRDAQRSRFAGRTPTLVPNGGRPSRPWTSMIRRGSAVRVRQRALQKTSKSRPFVSDRLARAPVCRRYRAFYGAFRSERRSVARPHVLVFNEQALAGAPLLVTSPVRRLPPLARLARARSAASLA